MIIKLKIIPQETSPNLQPDPARGALAPEVTQLEPRGSEKTTNDLCCFTTIKTFYCIIRVLACVGCKWAKGACSINIWNVNLPGAQVRSPVCGQKHLLAENTPPHAALFNVSLSTSHPHLLLERNTINWVAIGRHLGYFQWGSLPFTSDMSRGVVVLGWVFLLFVGAVSSDHAGRMGTFHRTQQDGSRSQTRARPRRDGSGFSGTHRPVPGPPFTPCRVPLTPAEHKTLDDNTHEVRCGLIRSLCSELVVNRYW